MYMRFGTHLVQFLDHEAFYLCLDNSLLVDLIRTNIAYLKTNWKLVGRPTIVLPILRCGHLSFNLLLVEVLLWLYWCDIFL